MQAQFWRTRRGRGCHPFFPFSVVFHHFISFVILLYELQMKKPVRVKRRLRTVVFTVKEAFTFKPRNYPFNLSFYFHEVLQHLKTFIYTSTPEYPRYYLCPMKRRRSKTRDHGKWKRHEFLPRVTKP